MPSSSFEHFTRHCWSQKHRVEYVQLVGIDMVDDLYQRPTIRVSDHPNQLRVRLRGASR